MKIGRLTTIFLVSTALLLACKLPVSLPATKPIDGYLLKSASELVFIQFTEDDNKLIGRIQYLSITTEDPPQIESDWKTFSGTRNGSSLILSFPSSVSLTGEIEKRQLILWLPQPDGHLENQTFIATTIQEYNQAVDSMQENFRQQQQMYHDAQATSTAIEATQRARQAEQQAVIDANAELEYALEILMEDTKKLASFSVSDTIDEFESDWKEMQEDYAIAVKDAEAGCGDGSNYVDVEVDVGDLEVDYGDIEVDQGDLEVDEITYESDLSTLQSDIQQVNNAWSNLQIAVANNSTGSPASKYSANEVNSYLSNAQNVINQAQGIWEAAKAKAEQYDKDARALLQEAYELLESMNCD